MDVTHWFCWITAAGAVMGLVAAVQQLLSHGLMPFVRAVFVISVVGLALVAVYPSIEVRPVGGGSPVALSTSAVPAESAPPGPGPLNPTTADPTVNSAEAAPVPPGLIVPAPLKPGPVMPPPVSPAPVNGAPFRSGAAPAERAQSTGLEPRSPTFLPAGQTLFAPPDVVYCPLCFSAYSSKGPVLGVKCPHCAAKVNLVTSPDYMVHRCGKCGRLYRTTYFPPAIGPYLFRYYCAGCKEYRWFPN